MKINQTIIHVALCLSQQVSTAPMMKNLQPLFDEPKLGTVPATPPAKIQYPGSTLEMDNFHAETLRWSKKTAILMGDLGAKTGHSNVKYRKNRKLLQSPLSPLGDQDAGEIQPSAPQQRVAQVPRPSEAPINASPPSPNWYFEFPQESHKPNWGALGICIMSMTAFLIRRLVKCCDSPQMEHDSEEFLRTYMRRPRP